MFLANVMFFRFFSPPKCLWHCGRGKTVSGVRGDRPTHRSTPTSNFPFLLRIQIQSIKTIPAEPLNELAVWPHIHSLTSTDGDWSENLTQFFLDSEQFHMIGRCYMTCLFRAQFFMIPAILKTKRWMYVGRCKVFLEAESENSKPVEKGIGIWVRPTLLY